MTAERSVAVGDDGAVGPAIEPNTVTRLRTPERDGYAAVQLGATRSSAAS